MWAIWNAVRVALLHRDGVRDRLALVVGAGVLVALVLFSETQAARTLPPVASASATPGRLEAPCAMARLPRPSGPSDVRG